MVDLGLIVGVERMQEIIDKIEALKAEKVRDGDEKAAGLLDVVLGFFHEG